MAPAASQNPRYEVNERPPLRTTLGYGLQFSLIASASLPSAHPGRRLTHSRRSGPGGARKCRGPSLPLWPSRP